jgi:hypothetical protein
MLDSTDIELYKEITDTVKELDSADTFELKLVNILKDFISNKINDLNSKILKIYKSYIKKRSKSKDYNINDLDFNKIPLNSYQTNILKRKNKLLSIHDDLEKYMIGSFTDDDFKRHLDDFLNFKKNLEEKPENNEGKFEEKNKLAKPESEIPNLLTTELILSTMSKDEWLTIKHLIFKLKIKKMMDTRYFQLKLKELLRKKKIEEKIENGRRLYKLK